MTRVTASLYDVNGRYVGMTDLWTRGQDIEISANSVLIGKWNREENWLQNSVHAVTFPTFGGKVVFEVR